MDTRELICIGCPLGCPLSIEMQDGQVKQVTGNTCKRGEDYARKEVTNPTRIVTSTVEVEGHEMASVKTSSDIPKGKIMDCIKALKGIRLKAPVHIGQVVLENVADTGVSVIATKEVQ